MPRKHVLRRPGLGVALSVAVLCALLPPAAALGADSVYWGDLFTDHIGFANLNDTASQTLDLGAGIVQGPFGVALDPAAGKIYWDNSDSHNGAGAIEVANLDGSDPHELKTGNADMAFPVGIAVDPVAGRVYWANADGNSIAFAKTDNSNVGENLMTGNAPVDGPSGIAVDPAAGIVYWTNSGTTDSIAFAKTDNSNVGDQLKTGNAPVNQPFGIAVDPAAGRVYWANASGNSIAFASTDNSDVGDKLATGNATVISPLGIAIDPAAERIYWGNADPKRISFAALDGTSADLVTDPTPGSGAFPVLLQSPRPAGPPVITGGSSAGAVLSCSTGAWAPDLVASFLYRAPQSFAYHWTRDGVDLLGATQSSLTADRAGVDYRCSVTATNHAGSATQTSDAARVSVAGPGPAVPGVPPPRPAAFAARTQVTLTLASARVPARGPVGIQIANANGFAVVATLAAQTAKPVAAAHHRRVKLATKRLTIPAHAKRTIKLSLPRSLQRLLAGQHRLALTLSLVVTDPAGHRRTVTATVTPRLQVAKRSR